MSRRDVLLSKLSATMDVDNARALLDEVIREQMLTLWKPMMIAPTDGTRVLVLDDGLVMIACCVNGHDHWTADEGYTVEPTHWMPLPSPPRVEP